MTSASYIGIGEYSAKKIYFFPGQRKNCEKISPYFSLSEVENFSKLHFFGEKLSRLAFFGEKLQKFANFGVIAMHDCGLKYHLPKRKQTKFPYVFIKL